MAELRTELQRQIMGCMAVATRERMSRGLSRAVTTRKLSEMTGRSGQVVGHSCGSMADRGLLKRVAPATYGLTRAGVAAIRAEYDGG